MKSVMQHNFSQIPKIDIPRSVFNRSHGHKTAFNAGYLIPFYIDEVLPGDTFKLNATLFARLATPICPFMDNLFLDTFYFFVPNRLVWDHWKNFMGEKDDPDDTTEYLIPTINSGEISTFATYSMYDYMGIPINIENVTVNALPFRGMNLIYNEWFRDQNLQDPVSVPKDDGPDGAALYQVMRRAKRHDYFTSCLPWPQKGPGVELPLGTSAPVIGNGNAITFTDGTNNHTMYKDSVPTHHMYGSNITGYLTGEAISVQDNTVANKAIGLWEGPSNKHFSGMIADLSSATAATINSLREAFQLQRMLERDARGGTRYIELVKSHFGVDSPDLRITRPQYLGGGSQRISINAVQQTAGAQLDPATGLPYNTGAATPQGNLAAYGLVTEQNGFHQSFTEHGYVFGIVNVRADLTYQQGLNRMWSRQTRYDFFWPALTHLGEQEVLNKEIYMQGSGEAADDEVFGYQERYAEYRYYPSKITSVLRSTSVTPIDQWHLSQLFDSLPVLTDRFWIEDIPPLDRVLAVPGEPHLIFDSYLDLHCARPMPVYSVPGLIDHF